MARNKSRRRKWRQHQRRRINKATRQQNKQLLYGCFVLVPLIAVSLIIAIYLLVHNVEKTEREQLRFRDYLIITPLPYMASTPITYTLTLPHTKTTG